MMRRWRLVVVAVLVGLVATVTVAGVAIARPVIPASVSVAQDELRVLVVCDDAQFTVAESLLTVTLERRVKLRRALIGMDAPTAQCASAGVWRIVELDAPLGERTIVDAATGEVVEVQAPES